MFIIQSGKSQNRGSSVLYPQQSSGSNQPGHFPFSSRANSGPPAGPEISTNPQGLTLMGELKPPGPQDLGSSFSSIFLSWKPLCPSNALFPPLSPLDPHFHSSLCASTSHTVLSPGSQKWGHSKCPRQPRRNPLPSVPPRHHEPGAACPRRAQLAGKQTDLGCQLVAASL